MSASWRAKSGPPAAPLLWGWVPPGASLTLCFLWESFLDATVVASLSPHPSSAESELVLLLIHFVTLDLSLPLSESQFPHLQNGSTHWALCAF